MNETTQKIKLSPARRATYMFATAMLAGNLCNSTCRTFGTQTPFSGYACPKPYVDMCFIPDTGLSRLLPESMRPKDMEGWGGINELGYPGPDIIVPKPPKTYRLGAAGGSTTYFPQGIHSYTSQLELTLSEMLEGTGCDVVEVHNMGVTGHGIQQISQTVAAGELVPYDFDALIVAEVFNFPKILRMYGDNNPNKNPVGLWAFQYTPFSLLLSQLANAAQHGGTHGVNFPLRTGVEEYLTVLDDIKLRLAEQDIQMFVGLHPDSRIENARVRERVETLLQGEHVETNPARVQVGGVKMRGDEHDTVLILKDEIAEGVRPYTLEHSIPLIDWDAAFWALPKQWDGQFFDDPNDVMHQNERASKLMAELAAPIILEHMHCE